MSKWFTYGRNAAEGLMWKSLKNKSLKNNQIGNKELSYYNLMPTIPEFSGIISCIKQSNVSSSFFVDLRYRDLTYACKVSPELSINCVNACNLQDIVTANMWI